MSHKHQQACCTPVEKKVFGLKKDLFFALLCGGLLLSAFVLEKLTAVSSIIYLILYAGCYFFGGYYTVIHSWESLKKKKFDIDFLMLVAALGAASLGHFAEGGLLLFLFSIGHSLEHYAMDKASDSIASLTELTPTQALKKQGNEFVSEYIENLQLGDVVLVKPNAKIPVDGVVVKGSSAVNQAPITGESIPVDKTPLIENTKEDFETISSQHKVYSGSLNGSSTLEVKVLKLAKDSTLSKLVDLVKNAETKKAPAQVFADKFAAIFVPAVLILVVFLLFAFVVLDETFKDSFYRAMAVLIAASPCALAISTPSAVLAGIARAAKKGILIKGGVSLQQLAKINTLAFDKTGTLTTGVPKLTKVIPYKNHTREEVVKKAVAVESLITHPLAKAIVRDGKQELKGMSIPEAKNLESLTARGVKALLNEKTIHIGNRRLMQEVTGKKVPKKLVHEMQQLEEKGHTAMLILEEQEYIGIIAVQDTARPEAFESIERLRKNVGIQKIMVLTGDHQLVANAVAKELKIAEAQGDLLPEQKVEAIKKAKQNYRIAMVGDGVNDAPAMANSDVGISMGAAGSDVALETAEVALLGDSIRQLPFAFKLAQKSVQIIKQNLFISIGVMVVLVPFTLFGLTIGPAVILHEGSTLLVVVNALRLLRYDL